METRKERFRDNLIKTRAMTATTKSTGRRKFI